GFADEVGKRDFRSRDQTETLALQSLVRRNQQLALHGPELIVLEFRQLPGPEHHVVAYQKRRIDFGVAMLVGVQVEHELADRTLKTGEPFLQDDEARARQFGGGFEIHAAETN